MTIRRFVLQGTTTGVGVFQLTRVQNYEVADNIFRAPARFGPAIGGLIREASREIISAVQTRVPFSTVAIRGHHPTSSTTRNRSIQHSLGGVLLSRFEIWRPGGRRPTGRGDGAPDKQSRRKRNKEMSLFTTASSYRTAGTLADSRFHMKARSDSWPGWMRSRKRERAQ